MDNPCLLSLSLKHICGISGGAFGGNRGARPVPPEKGVFPLDHMHECDLVGYIYGSHLFECVV